MDELRTRSSLLKAKAAILLLLTLLSCAMLSCSQSDKNRISDLPESTAAFWGDSAAILIAKNPQNGYCISILKNKEMTLAHFERGDSISRYALLEQLPDCLSDYEKSATGVFSVVKIESAIGLPAKVLLAAQTQYELESAKSASDNMEKETIAITIPISDRNLLRELVRRFGWVGVF